MSGDSFPIPPGIYSSGAASDITAVFPPGGDPAADMALRLVLIQYLLDPEVEAAVVKGQTLLNVFMYGGNKTERSLLGLRAERRQEESKLKYKSNG